ncbi:solute carrier family 22 member 3-like isoform X2 [Cylas formicarius]|uniref:solute carrier family 22 member 3-like isoform X2 n=1 Tax=Cylas formicarius TaxID=197179 RepID=UPI002958DA38|nr:solute carrier family 22 member 3-like isoform X2 [Cylas formicarius]
MRNQQRFFMADETHQAREDIIRDTIGDFGRWQLKISLLMSLLKFPMAWFQMSIIFLAPPMSFWCRKPEDADEWMRLYDVENATASNEGLNKGHCYMTNSTDNQSYNVACPYGYVYNTSVFKSTITSEWNLVCANQRLMDVTQVTLMFGVLTGNVVCGILADKHGRRKILLFCILFQAVLGMVASYVPWFWVFVVVRFLLAIANGGSMVTSFVICMESVGGQWRTLVSIFYHVPFVLSYSIMSGVAYLLRDWRQFHFALSSLSALYILYVWLIPESPRWLLAVGMKTEATAVLKAAASENKRDPDQVQKVVEEFIGVSTEQRNKVPFKSLFTTTELRKRTVLLALVWAISGVTFYAFSQYTGHIGDNIFVVVAVTGLFAVPGFTICAVLIGTLGRRYTQIVAHVATAICFISLLLVPKGVYTYDWPRILLSGLGATGTAMSLPALYLYTGELYPTVLRNAGVGFASMCARLASMVAPLVLALQESAQYLPLAVLAAITLAEVGLILLLPDTGSRWLPNTIEEVEMSAPKSALKNNRKYQSVLQKEVY